MSQKDIAEVLGISKGTVDSSLFYFKRRIGRRPLKGSSADIAEVKQGDIISAVDGKDISGMNVSDVASIVRGPENSVVELTMVIKLYY